MKTFYSKAFAKYSPLFPILLLGIIIYAWVLKLNVMPPEIISQANINLFQKFGFSSNYIIENAKLFYDIEFVASLLSIVAAFFLGMSLIGKTSGLVIATFMGLYPYYIASTYSAETITIFFFILFLFFQLQATINYSKVFSAFAGVFFMLSIMCNPICLFLGLIMYIYQAISSRNIAVLYNFLLFVGGALLVFIIYAIFLSVFGIETTLPKIISTAFSEFGQNFGIFKSAPLDYIKTIISPLFTETLAYPAVYTETINKFSYLHYLAVFSAIFGLLYSLVEQKARILTIISLIVLIQAFFMTISFGFLFLFVIILGSYLIDKIFHDVFC